MTPSHEAALALARRILADGVYGYAHERGVYLAGSQGREWVGPEDVTGLATALLATEARATATEGHALQAELASAEQAVADLMTVCEQAEADRPRLQTALAAYTRERLADQGEQAAAAAYAVMTLQTALAAAEGDRDAAVEWIGVVRDELTREGWPAGDRNVALANLRGLLSWWRAEVDGDPVAERDAALARAEAAEQQAATLRSERDGWRQAATDSAVVFRADIATLRAALQELHGAVQTQGCPVCKPVNGWGHTQDCRISAALPPPRRTEVGDAALHGGPDGE